MKHLSLSILIMLMCFNGNAQEVKEQKVEALLIGVSHWANYGRKGLDVVQTNEPDILSEQYQKELKEIAAKIEKFNPDKIFVERVLDYQPKLDSLFQLYKTTDWGKNRRNEIYQLGFRLAKSLNHKKVYGIDFHDTEFPFDSVMKVIQKEKQFNVMNKLQGAFQLFANTYNKMVAEKKSLPEILEYLNSEEGRSANQEVYLTYMTKVGKLDNDIGAFLASEWIRRNIYMYSYILKYLEPEDDKIMILLGAGHIAAIKNMIDFNPEWRVVELNELMGN